MTPHLSPICPSWSLRAWPPLCWELTRKERLPLQHLSTQVTSRGERGAACTGQTIWAGHADNGDAGMAWDWVQIAEGVVAMADPMSVVTNLRLVGPEGAVLTAFESALHLNEIVHQLPWQDAVERALHQRAA